MHSWLPDAHSQAPAPVSGLMSGVLLSVAFYAILRVQAIAAPVIGPDLMRGMLVTAGLLSLAVAAALIIPQRDLKRMLAYSSIEHMGLLALAAAAGGVLALSAALLHVLGHGLAKSSTFVVSGRILATEGTTSTTDIRGLLARRPGVAVPFLVGMVALLGLPPFSLFFSEVAIVIAGVERGLDLGDGGGRLVDAGPLRRPGPAHLGGDVRSGTATGAVSRRTTRRASTHHSRTVAPSRAGARRDRGDRVRRRPVLDDPVPRPPLSWERRQ